MLSGFTPEFKFKKKKQKTALLLTLFDRLCKSENVLQKDGLLFDHLLRSYIDFLAFLV